MHDPVEFLVKHQRLRYIVAQHPEVRLVLKMGDPLRQTGLEVIERYHLARRAGLRRVPAKQRLDDVAHQEAARACDQDGRSGKLGQNRRQVSQQFGNVVFDYVRIELHVRQHPAGKFGATIIKRMAPVRMAVIRHSRSCDK